MLSARQLFLQNLAQTSSSPLMIEVERAEGIYFFSPDGKRYIDLISGIAVSSVGHRHPKVLQAIQQQMDKYLHLMVYGEFIQNPQVQFAQLLTQHLPAPLDNVYFVNSGTEATEGAMKLAKRYTGRKEIISCYKAYHGSTQGALSIGGGEHFKQSFRPLLPAIRQIHFGSFSDLEQITQQTACVILETIQGEAGVISACTPYFKALRAKCTQTGTLLILDECQTGLGRTGTMWAFEHYGIQPDILLLAKALGGGLPLGAFISSVEIMGGLKEKPILGHITTFGGHPLCCAAGLASMQVIVEEKLFADAEAKGMLFRQYLQHPAILQIRQIGLMIAVEFESFEILKTIIDKAIELGVLTDWFLYCDNAMRIAPPLNITETQIAEVCNLLLQVIEAIYSIK